MKREELNTLLTEWEQFKKANWYHSDAIDVEKYLMEKFAEIKALSLPPAEGAEAFVKSKGLNLDYVKGIQLFLNPKYTVIDLMTEFAAQQQPTAEGAEENVIYHNLTQPFRRILQSVALHGYDIVFAERDCVKCATDFATLHAQRIAEKMVEERMEQYKAQFKDRPNPLEVNPYDSKGIKRIRNRKIH